MKGRDIIRFFGAIFLLIVVHAILFDLNEHDVTQFMIVAGFYTVICAIREPSQQGGAA